MKRYVPILALLAALLAVSVFVPSALPESPIKSPSGPYELAESNSYKASWAFSKANNALNIWMDYQNQGTKLFPQHPVHTPVDVAREWLKKDSYHWTTENSAADLYPFLVTGSYYLNSSYSGSLEFAMEMERAISGEGLPKNIDIRSGNIIPTRVQSDSSLSSLDAEIFGASEYVKDGLLPIIELKGNSIWSDRALEILDEILESAPYDTEFGKIPSSGTEANGEMLQSLTRAYLFTGDSKYFEAAQNIGDFYSDILDRRNGIPCDWDFLSGNCIREFNLRDHGNEVVPGMLELLYLEKSEDPEAYARHSQSIRLMLDSLLEIGINEDHIWISNTKLNDNWGYLLNAYYQFYLLTGEEKYLDVISNSLENLHKYSVWGRTDAYADTVESALYLAGYIEMPDSVFRWMDEMMGNMNRIGLEHDYKDGNYIRTSLMYALYHTKGAYIEDWNPGTRIGGHIEGDTLYLHIALDEPRTVSVRFDTPRHSDIMGLEKNYPRLNAFPEWYAVSTSSYKITLDESSASSFSTSPRNGFLIQVDDSVNIKIEPIYD
ncbi:MAG: hypothetical protein QF775_01725 [archaeon]|jgi:hypothetical protein|nr:hypothetical protein [Euryarchaeota archaeon]MDP6704185.1 hypothetical protein [archaeon]|tara:strand:+ start:6214 stop:7857 length:1644 start_codon:yes stop_codon:yes gene_type:complete